MFSPFSFFSDWFAPDTPAKREYAGEGYEGLAAQTALQPGWTAAEQRWRPVWADIGNTELQAQLYGYGGNKGLMRLGKQAARNTIRNVRGWAPDQYNLLDTLAGQARNELENPYALSPAEVREVTQASLSNPALASFGAQPRDAYTTYANLGRAATQRAAQRRAFAGDVMDAENAYLTMPALATRNATLQSGLGRPVGPSIIQPWNQFTQDLYNTNYNAQAAAGIAGSNAATAAGDY